MDPQTRAIEAFEGGALRVILTGPVGAGGRAHVDALRQRLAPQFPGGVRRVNAAGKEAESTTPERPGRALLLVEELDLASDPAALLDALDGEDVRVLATTHRRSELPESVWIELEPLGLEAGMRYFEQRAHEVGSWPEATRDERLRTLVELLDGLPELLSLAAEATAELGWSGIVRALERDPMLLISDDSWAPLSSLRSQWKRLREPQRQLLAQLRVFRGGFTLESAAALLKLEDKPALDELRELVREHLVRVAPADESGRGRFRVYSFLRCWMHAALGEVEGELSRRHAAHFAEAAGAPLSEDLPDVLAVAEMAPPTVSLRASLRAETLLLRRGEARRLVALISSALHGQGVPEPLRAGGLRARGRARRALGDVDRSHKDLIQALEMFADVGDLRGQAMSTRDLATLALVCGKHDEARTRFEVASEGFEKLGERRAQAMAMDGLAAVLYLSGEADEATRTCLQALRILDELRDRSGEAVVRGHLGLIALDRGLLDEAKLQLSMTMAIHHELGRPRFEAADRANLALAALDEGDTDSAREMFELAVAAFRELADARAAAFALLDLGLCHEVSGHPEAARICYVEAVTTGRRLELRRVVALSLAYQGRLAADAGRAAEAEVAFAEASKRVSSPEEHELLRLCEAHIHHAGVTSRVVGRTVALRCAERLLARCSALTTLFVDATSCSWRLGEEIRVSLERRPTLWRVFSCLLAHRLAEEGEPLSREALFAAAWPGERISESSQAGRVRTAVYSLRKMGLGEALESSEGGYALTRGLRVVREG